VATPHRKVWVLVAILREAAAEDGPQD
jgi:hypothetical protein